MRRLYKEIFVYSVLYTDFWYEFYQYGMSYSNRILRLLSLFPFPCGNKSQKHKH